MSETNVECGLDEPVTSVAARAYTQLQMRVGQTTRLTLGAVSALQVQRFAQAVGDPGFSHASTHRSGAGAVAPALFVSSIQEWSAGPPDQRLGLEGASGPEAMAHALGGLRLTGTGQELEFFEPIVDGTVVRVELALEHVELKAGAGGDFLLIVVSRTFLDAAHRLLLTCREKFVAR